MNGILRGTLAAASGLLLAAVMEAQQVRIDIDSPTQGQTVEIETAVRGKVSDPKQRVYVLVRPLRAQEWWVQRTPAPPNRDGSWETLAYFGTDTEGAGEEYQVIAITTKRRLQERQKFRELPEVTAYSDTVTVRRVVAP